MYAFRLLVTIFFWLANQQSILAQQVIPSHQGMPARIRFEHLTTADGLPENSVQCMLQDHLGFIWMGTFNGLVRYDGTQMVDFQPDNKNKYSFKGRDVESLYEDHNGDIWIGCERLVRFERTTGRFIEYPQKAPETHVGANSVAFIHEDRRGDIWTITLNYLDGRTLLNRLSPKTASWTYFRYNPTNPHSLANNSVYLNNTNHIKNFAFLEDKSGTIWVTTEGDGQNTLHRFDSKTVQFSRFMPKVSKAIATDFRRITMMTEDKQGQLYLSSFDNGKGVFRLNPQTGQVTQFKHNSQNANSLRCDSLTKIHLSQDGGVWLPTDQGLDRMDPKTGQFTHFISKPNDPTSPSPGLLKFLAELPNGDLWFKATDGLNFYDKRRQQFVRYQQLNEPDGLQAEGSITSFLVDRTGFVWVGKFDDGVYKQSRLIKFPLITSGSSTPKQHIPNPDSGSVIQKIYEAPSEPGILWLGTEAGLERIERKTGRRTLYRHNSRNSQSIGEGTVWAMAEDKQRQFWVGSFQGGLNRFDRQRGTFTHFVHDPTNANSLMSNYIRALFPASDGTLWIGTFPGLDHYDPVRQTFTHYYKADSLYIPALYARLQSLTSSRQPVAAIQRPGNTVNKTVELSVGQATDLLLVVGGEWTPESRLDYGWLEDERGKQLWTTTYSQSAGDGPTGQIRNQISVIHLQAGRYRLRYRSNDSYAYGQWSDGPPYHPELWGIQCFALTPTESQTMTQLAHRRSVTGLASVYVSALAEDAQKRIMIGTALMGSVQVLNPTNGHFTNYLTHVNGLSTIKCFLADTRPGCFWVGDFTAGLLLVDGMGRILKHYTRANGLPNNSVLSVQRDKKGYLWIGMANGLARLDPKTDEVRPFSQRNGLPGIFIRTWCASNGEVYAASQDRVVAFDPDQVQADPVAPPVVLTNLVINGKPATLGQGGQLPVDISTDISVAKAITLLHTQNDLLFQFTALSYNRGNESQYAYQLSPIDKGWMQNGTMRQARYSDLQPGAYTFWVKAANADGVWNEKGTSIQLTILPPWWRTWWAYLAYGLLLSGAVWAFIAYRSRALRRANRLLEEKVALRTNQVQLQKEEIAAQRDYLEETLSNLKSTQNQLIQKEKMASLGELTAGIAHEIQNPLNFVNNFSEVSTELVDELKEGPFQKLPDSEKEYADEILGDLTQNLQKITHHGGRASSIVKGMLEHSRSTSGERQATDLNALADEYLRLAYQGLRAKDKTFNADLKTDFDPTLGLVDVVPQEIGRVLLNLFNNAFYAVQQKQKTAPAEYQPRVSVSTQRSKSGVEIRVKDNGTGIPDVVKAKIFQPFFTTKPTGEGTGLGLSLSYDIITKGHGGTLMVESQQGQGTDFIIRLPIV